MRDLPHQTRRPTAAQRRLLRRREHDRARVAQARYLFIDGRISKNDLGAPHALDGHTSTLVAFFSDAATLVNRAQRRDGLPRAFSKRNAARSHPAAVFCRPAYVPARIWRRTPQPTTFSSTASVPGGSRSYPPPAPTLAVASSPASTSLACRHHDRKHNTESATSWTSASSALATSATQWRDT